MEDPTSILCRIKAAIEAMRFAEDNNYLFTMEELNAIKSKFMELVSII